MKTCKYLFGKLSVRGRRDWPSLGPAGLSLKLTCLSRVLSLLLWLSLLAAASVQAAPAPTITKIYDAPGQIWGGLAGDGNNLYLTTLAKSSGFTYSKVVSITATGTERWQWDNGCPQAGGNMRLVPTISPDGTRLWLGADHGKVFCLDTTLSGSLSYCQPHRPYGARPGGLGPYQRHRHQ